MKVKRLTMRSFRGIDDLTLDFDPSVTVLIGNNGVGKSSILNSLSTLFSDLVGRLRTSTGSGIVEGDSRQFFSESDIKDGAQESSVSIQASFLSLADVEIERTTEQKALDLENVSWSVTRFQKDQGKGSLRDSGQLHLIVDRLHEQFFSSDPKLFLLVFYPVNRTVPDTPLKALSTEQSHAFQQLQAYDQSLIKGRLDFAL
ncbi:MAG: AAA family ATPase, partial [Phormidesmis sp. CAN_BIN36]|nr:AAA family ATPase [Phormidesmis sp. CAN_BIN36]